MSDEKGVLKVETSKVDPSEDPETPKGEGWELNRVEKLYKEKESTGGSLTAATRQKSVDKLVYVFTKRIPKM